MKWLLKMVTSYPFIGYRTAKPILARPVILQHGLLTTSACWLLNSPEKSLGFIMADQGYNVWMPNNRGTTFSMKHTTLDPHKSSDQKKYCDFSFHEMGIYDMPACIEYVLNKTAQKDLYYISHSQGTTQFFIMMSMRPEYNEKVVHMSALAPIAFLDHTRGTLRALTFFGSTLAKVANFFNIYDVLPNTPIIRAVQNAFCSTIEITEVLCENMLFLITGYDAQEINTTLIPIIMTYDPAGSSVKQLVHFSQLATNGEKFRQFDYGEEENLKRYNQKAPPDYNVTQITTPVMLHYSQNDWISGIPDVMKLKSFLPHGDSLQVPFYCFNHVDFMWATDVWKMLYKPMLDVIKQF